MRRRRSAPTILPGGERCQIRHSVGDTNWRAVLHCPQAFARNPRDRPARRFGGLFTSTRAAAQGLGEVDAQLIAQRDVGDWPAFFRTAVAARKNILVSGATGSGKTTFAKAADPADPAGRTAAHDRGYARARRRASQCRAHGLFERATGAGEGRPQAIARECAAHAARSHPLARATGRHGLSFICAT